MTVFSTTKLRDFIGIERNAPLDLHDTGRMCSATPTLLGWRLTALGLNPRAIALACPDVYGNLRSVCAACPLKQRCLDDMMECGNPPGWESYCPNSGTIRLLQ